MNEPVRSGGRGKSWAVAVVLLVIVLGGGGVAAYKFVLYPRQVTAELTRKYAEMDELIGKVDLDAVAQGYMTGEASRALEEVQGLVRMARGMAALVGEIQAQCSTKVSKVSVRGSEATVDAERTLTVGVARLGGAKTVVSQEKHVWQKSGGEWRIAKIEGDAFQKLLDSIPLPRVR